MVSQNFVLPASLQPARENGSSSYMPSFVALAIIAALGALACCVGQVWARRCLRPKSKRRGYVEGDEEEGHGVSSPVKEEKMDSSA